MYYRHFARFHPGETTSIVFPAVLPTVMILGMVGEQSRDVAEATVQQLILRLGRQLMKIDLSESTQAAILSHQTIDVAVA